MILYYDLHIHTALSPCADNDMTPNNIVNMALLKGLDVIAVTDHNSAENARAVIKAGEKAGLTVIAGMEIETSEEVHVLSLFPSADAAEEVQRQVYRSLPDAKNPENIFGSQLLFDESDNITGKNERLLLTATSLGITEVFRLVAAAGGIAIPSHVDRPSYSILSNLGFIPDELPLTAIELSKNISDKNEFYKMRPELKKYKAVFNSDAHSLGDISEKINFIDVLHNKPNEIIRFFG
jgi:PHP family Zn ribbon phosphoesterase